MKRKRKDILRLTVVGAAFLFYAAICFGTRATVEFEKKTERDDAGAKLSFLDAFKVFSSARCINCHPAGDAPLQGEDSHSHTFLVERGRDGKGFPAMRCNACHQDFNASGEHAPPGADEWHLPPPETKMVFQGKTAKQLCEQLKNPKLNGGRNLRQVANHLDTKLVRWAWNPGGNRLTPPLEYQEFVRKFAEWRDQGGACPE